jgi:hypothetical protein
MSLQCKIFTSQLNYSATKDQGSQPFFPYYICYMYDMIKAFISPGMIIFYNCFYLIVVWPPCIVLRWLCYFHCRYAITTIASIAIHTTHPCPTPIFHQSLHSGFITRGPRASQLAKAGRCSEQMCLCPVGCTSC